MTIGHREFGRTPDGQPVTLFTLSAGGVTAQVMNYGAIIVSVETPDRQGQRANINLGYDQLDPYLQRHSYLGSTVGRYCNRIARGQFELDGVTYRLVTNNGPNHLHGGTVGFDRLMWDADLFERDGQLGVRMQTLSPDGQEGYPGNLQVTAEFSLGEDGTLTLVYRAQTDAPTVINMTNHAYWNLGGVGSGDVLDHELQLDCSQFLEVDETLIPTGKLLDVTGTPLDFRQFHAIGERIDQLAATKGYDHCFVIDGSPGTLRRCATLRHPPSGRQMEVWTTQPGVQLYTGQHLGGGHAPYSGMCLETQHFPDSPNHPEFPSTRLEPGQTFEETTQFRFGLVQG
ncbi:MAG: galactose mutarotase [Planctomycetota bacterium]|nr:MAG: galactose mutarotase [Planctomycetota bacterium]